MLLLLLITIPSSLIGGGLLFKTLTSNGLTNYIRISYAKRQAIKKIKKGIKTHNYGLFKLGFDKLYNLDFHYHTEYFATQMEKRNLNKTIVDSSLLFKLKYDPEYLVKQFELLSSNISRQHSDLVEDNNEIFKEQIEDLERRKIELEDTLEQYNTISKSSGQNVIGQLNEINRMKEELAMEKLKLDEIKKMLYNF